MPFAVIAQSTRLEDAGAPEPIDFAAQRVEAADIGEGADGNPQLAEQALLDQAILRHRQRAGIGKHGNPLRQPLRALRGHVLEIEGGHVDLRRELGQGRLVAVVADQQRRELARTGVRRGVHHQETQAQGRAGERHHACQLPSAQNADRRHSG